MSRINVAALTRPIDVDNRIPLRNYYRMVENVYRQAAIFREEKNYLNLYVQLLKYISLVSETIPSHQDYKVSTYDRLRADAKKKMLGAFEEAEKIKPLAEAERDQLNRELSRGGAWAQTSNNYSQDESATPYQSYGGDDGFLGASAIVSGGPASYLSSSGPLTASAPPPLPTPGASMDLLTGPVNSTYYYAPTATQPSAVAVTASTPSFNIARASAETLSRHSFFSSPYNSSSSTSTTHVQAPRVQYPTAIEASPVDISSYSDDWSRASSATSAQDAQAVPTSPSSAATASLMAMSMASPAPSPHQQQLSQLPPATAARPPIELPDLHIRTDLLPQPSPPPLEAQVQSVSTGSGSLGNGGLTPFISQQPRPENVADPRPGPAQTSFMGSSGKDDDLSIMKGPKHLHIATRMMSEFLRVARNNTSRNLETCGILAGGLKKGVFYVTTLIIPKQESTSDSCQTVDEEMIFDVQDKRGLFQLGWIHTHPTQTCFMSSVDIHTHYSYQVMLPEAIAIVMAPTDPSKRYGIFRLSDPGGLKVVQQCQKKGFHPHESPPGGGSIYEHSSHVYMNDRLQFDVVDLR